MNKRKSCPLGQRRWHQCSLQQRAERPRMASTMALDASRSFLQTVKELTDRGVTLVSTSDSIDSSCNEDISARFRSPRILRWPTLPNLHLRIGSADRSRQPPVDPPSGDGRAERAGRNRGTSPHQVRASASCPGNVADGLWIPAQDVGDGQRHGGQRNVMYEPSAPTAPISWALASSDSR